MNAGECNSHCVVSMNGLLNYYERQWRLGNISITQMMAWIAEWYRG